ncbi:MAG: phosphonate ABC transporter, permease protein PhnE, partial [Roseomonas sp.]|nr:phosphonate ABC transporter, permease protein PhnE [Roseomonas sp.]
MSLTVQAVAIRWQQERQAGRRRRLLWSIAFLAATWLAAWVGQVDAARLLAGLPRAADYIARTVPTLRMDSLGADLAEWMWGVDVWLGLLLDTILIAYVGTVVGGAAALLLSFPAAATLAPPWAVLIARRTAEFARTVPTLVFALIFV